MDGQEAIVIASAARTPVASFNGALASVPAHEQLARFSASDLLTFPFGTVYSSCTTMARPT